MDTHSMRQPDQSGYFEDITVHGFVPESPRVLTQRERTGDVRMNTHAQK
jgi:hypothetical protein